MDTLARRGRYDEKKHKRGKGGRFAKKAARFFVPPPLRARNNPEANVFRQHADGDVTHVSEDGTQRMVYDAGTGQFDQQVRQPDGSWQSIGKRGKLATYLLTKLGWRVGEAEDQPPAAPASAPNPNAPDPNAPSAAPSAGPGPHESTAPLAVDTDFPTRDAGDLEAIQGEMESQNPPPLTPEQEQTVRDYSVTAYHDMNECLRTGQSCTAEANTRNGQLRDALRPLGEPVTVFRSTNLEHLGGATSIDDLERLAGFDISDNGFSSTSLDPSVTEIFGDVDMQIEVPAGTPAIFTGSRAAIQDEQELILGPRTRFRVLEVNRNTPSGRPAVRLQVIS
jgi:hypothetical protein